jgi:hypothetical protein
MIGFKRGINLILSLFNDGENTVFSSLRYENYLLKRQNLYNDYNLHLKEKIK